MLENISPARKSHLDATLGVVEEARKICDLNLTSSEFEDQEDVSIRMAIHKKMEQPLSEVAKENEGLFVRFDSRYTPYIICVLKIIEYMSLTGPEAL